MQIIRTEVARSTAPTGQPVLRVLFCGEGGDCVTVDMARIEDGADDLASIARAKAILVQTATFDDAVNDYDARSNGNFDEVTVTAANADDGAIYIFEYRDGEGAARFRRRACRHSTPPGTRLFAVRSSFWSIWSRGRTICPAGWCECAAKAARCFAPSTSRRRRLPVRAADDVAETAAPRRATSACSG